LLGVVFLVGICRAIPFALSKMANGGARTSVVFLGASGPIARELQWLLPLKPQLVSHDEFSYTGPMGPAVQGL
jgi:hypothetical protein